MATIQRENIGHLNDKLIVNLSKEDYLPSFEKSLKSYAKSANIPGFRKGMVPAGLVKKMYGQSAFSDEVLRTVEKELNQYMEQEKIDIFAQPLPLENDARMLDMNNPSDYAFAFEIGLKPEIAIEAGNIKVTRFKIEVTEQMIDEEIERLRTRYGKMTEPELVDNEEDVLNLQMTESDAEGNPVEGGISKANSLLVKYFTAAEQKKLMGKKKDDSFTIRLADVFEDKEREWVMEDLGLDKNDPLQAEKYFLFTITKIGFVEKATMDPDFFKTAYPGKEITTETEFRDAVKADIESYYASQSSNQVQDQIYHHLLEHTPITFPENFLKRWLQMGTEKPKSPEEAEAEYPSFENQLKWSLISTKLLNENKITVEQEEIKDQAKAQMLNYMGGNNLGDTSWLDEYANRMLNDQKFVEQTYYQLQTAKLFRLLETQVSAEEQAISAEAFAEKLHHHHH